MVETVKCVVVGDGMLYEDSKFTLKTCLLVAYTENKDEDYFFPHVSILCFYWYIMLNGSLTHGIKITLPSSRTEKYPISKFLIFQKTLAHVSSLQIFCQEIMFFY